MEHLAAAAFIFQILANAVVGVRLLLLARRTREVPELALGSAFILIGVVGLPLGIVARAGITASELVAQIVYASSLTVQALASLAIFAGTWRIFRPKEAWAVGLVAAAAAALLASLAGQAVTIGFFADRVGGFWYYLGYATRALAFAWAAIESFRYHGLLRRRLRVGLADPVVADRFRLWGISTGAAVLAFLIFLGGHLSNRDVSQSPVVLAATACVVLVSGATTWLAFFPPGAYTRRVATRAAAPSAAT